MPPAGFEGFWEKVSQRPRPPEMDAIRAIAKKYQPKFTLPRRLLKKGVGKMAGVLPLG